MTRRKVAELIFNYINSIGFKPYNIQYGNGYFIFDKGEDGVIHFSIKGLYGWKFAMWINTNKEELLDEDGKTEYHALQFFVQHKDNIDKFKPTRSCFLSEYDLHEIENPAPYQWYQIKNIIKMIKRHPFISYYYDACECCEFTGDSFIMRYFKSKLRVIFRSTKTLYQDWIPITWVKFKLLFCGKNIIVNTIKIIDGNTHGCISSPRWDLDILFNEDSTNELECKFLNKWFSRRNNNIAINIHRVGIEGYYSYVEEA
jgi:hypothetical protein